MSTLLASLLEVVVPVFVVIGCGVLLGRYLKPDLSSLNRTGLYVAVPALVFNSLANTELAFQDVMRLVGGQALFLLVMCALAWCLGWRFATPTRRGLMATSMYGNSANMMFPVTLFAFGEAGLERASVLFVLSAMVLFSTGPLVLAGGQGRGFRRSLAGVLKLPVLWAALLGIVLNVLGWSLPIGLERGIDIIADASIPLVLLTLGMQIERSGVPLPTVVNWLGSGVKLILGPLVGYLTGFLVGAQGLDLAVLVLLGAMPPAVNNFMLALEFGSNAEEVARTVVLATLGALVSISVVVSLLGMVVL